MLNIGLYKFGGCKIFTGPKKLQVQKEALTGRGAKALYLYLHTGGVEALMYYEKLNSKVTPVLHITFVGGKDFLGAEEEK